MLNVKEKLTIYLEKYCSSCLKVKDMIHLAKETNFQNIFWTVTAMKINYLILVFPIIFDFFMILL